MKFILTIANKKYRLEAVHIDSAIDKVMKAGEKLLANNERMTVHAEECGNKVHVITKRNGMDHWKYPGWQFGAVDKSQFC